LREIETERGGIAVNAPFWITKPAFPAPSAAHSLSFAPVDAPARRSGAADGLETRAIGAEQAEELLGDWLDLIGRSAEPNGFLEPGFALSAIRHFPAQARPTFLAVWKNDASGRRLIALFPMVAPRFASLARGWLHKQAPLATPIVDRDLADEAATALLDWFATHRHGAGAVLFPKIPLSGPVFAALTRAARATGRDWRVLDAHERAALLPGDDPQEAWTRRSSRKALNEVLRRRRRLEEAGPLRRLAFATPGEMPAAIEAFLALEASGWKSRRGALLDDPALAAFARGAIRLLAREGKCRIHSLELAGRPIAMGVVIESAGRAYFWKIAYDEAWRAQAPGVQLAYDVTLSQMERRDLDMTDSCAIANHPMIDRVWPDRLAIGDLMIQSRPDAPARFSRAFLQETLRRRLRAMAKTAYYRLRKRKER
jgi:CelD/BcsL family acetyltransferase involved in cellulose biosynthesis